MKNHPRPNETSGNRRRRPTSCGHSSEEEQEIERQRPLKQRMELREIVIEVLLPGTKNRAPHRPIACSSLSTLIPERADGQAELGEHGIARMAPCPSARQAQDEPEWQMVPRGASRSAAFL